MLPHIARSKSRNSSSVPNQARSKERVNSMTRQKQTDKHGESVHQYTVPDNAVVVEACDVCRSCGCTLLPVEIDLCFSCSRGIDKHIRRFTAVNKVKER